MKRVSTSLRAARDTRDRIVRLLELMAKCRDGSGRPYDAMTLRAAIYEVRTMDIGDHIAGRSA